MFLTWIRVSFVLRYYDFYHQVQECNTSEFNGSDRQVMTVDNNLLRSPLRSSSGAAKNCVSYAIQRIYFQNTTSLVHDDEYGVESKQIWNEKKTGTVVTLYLILTVYRRVPILWTLEVELGILITFKMTETLQKKNEFLILVAVKITVISQNGQV